MAKLIAVEWDRREVRLLVGHKRGTQLMVDNAIALPLTPDNVEETFADPNVAQVLGQALNKLGIAKADALVCIGRSSIELRTLQLPQAEEDDIPDMVRFQAMRQFANMSDSWPLDYVRLPITGQDGIQVLAAAINPVTVQQVRKNCEEAGLTVQKMVLRPLGAAQLLSLAPAAMRDRCLLMVDMLGDEADLAIIDAGQVVFIRTVRLPGDDDAAVLNSLIGEMRRTLVASASQRGGKSVEQVVVWANKSTAQRFAELAAEQLKLPIELIDPFSLVGISPSAKKDVSADRSGRFAPLVGTLATESAEGAQTMDFLHPRKKAVKKKPILKYSLYGAAAAVLVLGGLGWYISSHRALDQEISGLIALSASLDNPKKLQDENSTKYSEIEKYLQRRVQWLDELENLSQKLPPSKDVLLGQTTFSINQGEFIGTISTQAYVSRTDIGPEIEQQVRDAQHKVEGKATQKAPRPLDGYPWSVDGKITIYPASASAVATAAKPATTNQPATASPGSEVKEVTSTEKPASDKPVNEPPAVAPVAPPATATTTPTTVDAPEAGEAPTPTSATEAPATPAPVSASGAPST